MIPASEKAHPAQRAKDMAPSVADRPSIFDMFLDPSIMADPYPLYRRVLAAGPSHDDDGLPVILTSYQDVSAALANERLSTDDRHDAMQKAMAASGALPPQLIAMLDRRSFLHRDPPDHTRLRGLAEQALTPSRIAAAVEAGLRVGDDLLGQAAGRGHLDLVADFAYPLPAAVISHLLGLSADSGPDVPWWRSQMSADFEAPAVAGEDCAGYSNSVQQQMVARFDDIISARRRHPADDIITDLLGHASAGALSSGEVNDTCRLLAVAAHETTTCLIANGMLALLRHPGQLALLRDDPSLAASAVEEVLRYDTPIQFTRRVAAGDTKVNGVPVGAGRMVLAWMAAANRDPARFAEPDRFDIRRQDQGHLGFGGGAHGCLGARLARPLARAVLAVVCARLAGPELIADPPPYLPSAVHAIESLPVSFTSVRPAIRRP
ncbi:MAG: cytochrome P450 [Streptosporangiaceae bacterium]